MLREQDSNKQSIQVTIRVRPHSDKELSEDSRTCVRVDENSLQLVNGGESRNFTFDSICDSHQSQEDIFQHVGVNSTHRCLQGYNCSIFAYGQTGAGKTFTMMGVNHEDPSSYQKRGLVPRTLEFLFENVDRQMAELRAQYLIKCTFLQIYNEQIIDLLNKNNSNLQIREDLKKGVYVQGLQEEIVSRSDQAMQILRRGSKGRHVGSTCYNQTSSRSHSVFSMLLESKSTKNGLMAVKTRRFHFIDLAGSERTKQSNGERLKEGCSINKSLHVLGMVINSLVESTEGKTRHVAYRDSKLTFLLKDALGGNSKTHLIANISPNFNSYQETLSTLTFARRVKLIKLNKASINQDASGNLDSLKQEIRRLKQEIVQLKASGIPQAFAIETVEPTPDANAGTLTKQQQLLRLQHTNDGKLGLEKILQQYIEESIEKDTKFELELLKRDERVTTLHSAIKLYSKNEAHLRMIVGLYEEKFRRMKELETKLRDRVEELSVAEQEAVVNYVVSEKELMIKELAQYKELLQETPFLRALLREQEGPKAEQISQQLATSLGFLRQIKETLDYKVQERQELNQLIDNYGLNKEDELSPKKRKALEKDFEAKELNYLEKLEQMSLEAAYLKGTIQENELILKDSVDRELTLEDKVKELETAQEQLTIQLKQTEEMQNTRYLALQRQKEQLERENGERLTKINLQLIDKEQELQKAESQVQELQRKNKKLEEQCQLHVQEHQRLVAKIQAQQEEVGAINKQLAAERETYEAQIQTKNNQVANLSRCISDLQGQIQSAKNVLDTELGERTKLEQTFAQEKQMLNKKINGLVEEIVSLNMTSSNLTTQLGLYKNESDKKTERLNDIQQQVERLTEQLDSERQAVRRREEELKETLKKKELTDSEMETQLKELNIQLIQMTENFNMQKIHTEMEAVKLAEDYHSVKQELFQLQKELDSKHKQIAKYQDSLNAVSQREKQLVKAKQELNSVLEQQKTRLKEEVDKTRKLHSDLEKIRSRQAELVHTIAASQKRLQVAEHKCKEVMSSNHSLIYQVQQAKDDADRKEKHLIRVTQEFQREVSQIKHELDSQKQRQASNQVHIKKVFEECLANKDKAVSDLKSQNSDLQVQLNQEHKKAEDRKTKTQQLENKVKQLEEAVADRESTLEAINEQMGLLQEEIEHMKNIFQQKFEERENNYNEFIDRKNEEIDQCRSLIQQHETAMEDLRQAFSLPRSNNLVQLVVQAKEAYGLISIQHQTHVSMRDRAQEASKAQSEEIARLKQTVELMDADNQQLRKELEGRVGREQGRDIEHQQAMSELQSQYMKEKQARSLASTQYETVLQDLQSRVDQGDIMIKQTLSEKQNLQKECERLEEQVTELGKRSEKMNAEVERLEELLKSVSAELEHQKKFRNNESKKEAILNSRVEALKAQAEKLKTELAQAYNLAAEKQTQVSDLEIAAIQVQTRIGEAQATNKQLSLKLEQLTEKLAHRETEIQSLESKRQQLQREIKNQTSLKHQELETLELQLSQDRMAQVERVKEQFMTELRRRDSEINQQQIASNAELAELRTQIKKSSQSFEAQLKLLKTTKASEDQLKKEVERLKLENEQLKSQVGINEDVERERENNANLKKLIDNLERQKQQLEGQIEDKEAGYKKLVGKLSREGSRDARAPLPPREKTNDLLQKSRAELLEYKQNFTTKKSNTFVNHHRKSIQQNHRLVKKLKSEIQAKEENFLAMREKAEEFCKTQEAKTTALKAECLKLEEQNNNLLAEKEFLASLRPQNQTLKEELSKMAQQYAKREQRVQDLQQAVHNLNYEILELKEELENAKKEPTRVATDARDVKIQYINKIKQQNSLLKREKQVLLEVKEENSRLKRENQVLTDKLAQETEEKLRKGQPERKVLKDNRASMNLLDNLGSNAQVTLKIELERKIAEIKYLQEGYAELCILLGIKRLPENKAKGESTIGLIMSLVQNILKEAADLKARLKDKQKELDSKNVTYDIMNKQYNHLKAKILEAKNAKEQTTLDPYSKRVLPSKIENTFSSMRSNIDQAFREADIKPTATNKLREVSRNNRNYP